MQAFIGQIQAFGFNFAPRGWAQCDGQLLQIAQYTALFSLLGTTYGGDGRVTFALPDLRGRTALHQGNGPGLTPRVLGQKTGSETNTIAVSQMPSHNHQVSAANAQGDDSDPTSGNAFGAASNDMFIESTPGTSMGNGTIKNAGGGQPVNNMQPYTVINFCIALQGIFPSRN